MRCKTTIAKLKFAKASGNDQINTELLNAEEYWTPNISTNIRQKIRESEETQTSGKQTLWLN